MTSKTIICESCGEVVEPHLYCPHCGKRLESVNSATSAGSIDTSGGRSTTTPTSTTEHPEQEVAQPTETDPTRASVARVGAEPRQDRSAPHAAAAVEAWICVIDGRPDSGLTLTRDCLTLHKRLAGGGHDAESIPWAQLKTVGVSGSSSAHWTLRLHTFDPARGTSAVHKVTLPATAANEVLAILAERGIGPGPQAGTAGVASDRTEGAMTLGGRGIRNVPSTGATVMLLDEPTPGTAERWTQPRQPTGPAGAEPPRRRGASPWTISGVIGTIAALVVAGVTIYNRVEAEQSYRTAMAELQQQIDDDNAAAQAQQDEWDRQQALAEDIADATDDIMVEVPDGKSHPTGYGSTEVYLTIKNTSGRTESFTVEMAVIDPDNRSNIHDSAILSTGTLAAGETAHVTAYFTSDSRDWPKNSQGEWTWKIASATGYSA